MLLTLVSQLSKAKLLRATAVCSPSVCRCMTSLQGKGCYTWRQIEENWNEMVDVKCRQMDEAGTLETTNWMVHK